MTATAPDELDTWALARWLTEHVGGEGTDVQIERIGVGVGVANVLHRIEWAGVDMVMRRPPPSAAQLTASAGNVLREASVLRALAGTDVAHPRLIALCDDPTVIGSPFLLMECVDGFTPVDPLPAAFTAPDAKAGLGPALVDALADVAAVDWRSVGLDGYGKPDGFLARQVDRWLWQLDGYRTRPLDDLDDVVAWLRSNLPHPGPIGLMHGDYSLFNVMIDHAAPARVAAIIDWDTSTIGEPLMDFGHLLSRWDEAGEPATTLGSGDIADRAGMCSRDDLRERYAQRTGFDLAGILFYEVLSLFKLACLMEGHYANEVRGVASGGRFADSGPGLLADALRIARGERD